MIFFLFSCGSSPRARGTPGRPPVRQRPARFIPACAGNTPCRQALRKHCSVHPRVRGEHFSYGRAVVLYFGSSPRARGTRSEEQPLVKLDRFIPACAGNTVRLPKLQERQPVHPRVRGEHDLAQHVHHRAPGSSPRARGTLLVRPCRQPPGRFIPACAGNTEPRKPLVAGSAVHPRVRGEHRILTYETHSENGSSPRARGTLQHSRSHALGKRFIPACAGNTSRRPGSP